MTMTNYDLVVGRSNFLLISASALFILLFIIIAYYIYQFNNPSSDSIFKVIQSPESTINIGSGSSINKATASSTKASSPSSTLAQSSLNSNAAPVGYHLASTPDKPEVFNISENIYGYPEAEAVCKSFGSEVATYEQIVAAAQKGANWCNYGWSAKQRVLYPVQKGVWNKMQDNYGSGKGACGQIWPVEFNKVNFAVQGGYQPNPNMQFGVNCYGVKQTPLAHESAKQALLSDKDIAIANAVAKLQANRQNITVLPFNQDIWSGSAPTA
jgi:hypothetical protein